MKYLRTTDGHVFMASNPTRRITYWQDTSVPDQEVAAVLNQATAAGVRIVVSDTPTDSAAGVEDTTTTEPAPPLPHTHDLIDVPEFVQAVESTVVAMVTQGDDMSIVFNADTRKLRFSAIVPKADAPPPAPSDTLGARLDVNDASVLIIPTGTRAVQDVNDASVLTITTGTDAVQDVNDASVLVITTTA